MVSLALRANSAVGLFSQPVGSLLFSGIIDEETDRFNIPVSPTSLATNVGAGDFTIAWFMRASTANNSAALSDVEDYVFQNADILFDRDNLPSAVRDFGVSLANGRVVFSVENSGGAQTAVGTSDVRGSAFVHAYVSRSASTGVMAIGVAGIREKQLTGPTGTISYQGGLGGHHDFLVVGTEKHGFPSASGYIGHVSVIAIYDSIVYPNSTYVVPASLADILALSPVACYPMDEGSGTTVRDIVGGIDGDIAAGGVPAWSALAPF